MKPEKIQLSEEERRTLQLNEIQLLLEVYRICRKYKIRYSLDGGTLLGAARHQGFIPWDDDADVVFLRDDYEKFYTVCQRDLDHGRFFLQDYRTDAEYRWGYAKLRLKGTEFVRVGQEHMKYRTGVCIDIFVLDRVSDSNFVRRWDYFQLFCIRKALYSELGKVAADSWPLRLWYRLLNFIPKGALFRWRNHIARKHQAKDTQLVSHYLWPYNDRCRFGMPAHCFDSYTTLEFEGMQFSVMGGYDEYLTLFYGDYMTPPPPERRCGPGEASKIELLPITLEDIHREYRLIQRQLQV